MFDQSKKSRDELIAKGDYSDDITSVVIPAKIKVIEKGAFSSCRYLSKVVFEKDSQLEVIEANAFSNTRLKSITIPRNVKEIHAAFPFSLEEITFEVGCQLQVIGAHAFGGLSDNTKHQFKKFCIPRTVTDIGERAFAHCDNVSFELGSCLQTIGDSAFFKCRLAKKTLCLPNTLCSLGERAFFACNIETLDLSKVSNLKTIPQEAFSFCNIKKIFMPANGCIEEIGEGAFKSNDFKSFDFKGVKRIQKDAFVGCEYLKKAVISTDCKLETLTSYEKIFEKECEIERKDLPIADRNNSSASENSLAGFLGKLKSIFKVK